MKFIHIVGTRPNFMKLASLINVMKDEFECKVIHTGQHYDKNMSEVFFKDLNLDEPDYYLGIKGGTHAKQTGEALIKIEEILEQEKPDGVIVYGDVNATLSGALAATKLHIPLIHVESGSRSFDKRMPEEVNRIMVDHVSDILLTCDFEAQNNLYMEGIEENVHVVGNTAIDTFKMVLGDLEDAPRPIEGDYVLCTLHRPSNVDDMERLNSIMVNLEKIPYKIIFPAHPRVRKIAQFSPDFYLPDNVEFVSPLGYGEFVNHLKHCKFAISDSGGVQCECTVLKKRLITIRDTTEHTLSVELGANVLCYKPEDIKPNLWEDIDFNYELPYIWDGDTSKRIVEIIKSYYEQS